MRSTSCRALESGSVDFVATDPPYNPQLKITMAGGKPAPRSTRTGAPTTRWSRRSLEATWPTAASYPEFLDRMEAVFAELRRVLRDARYACVIVRDAYQDGRYRFTGSDLAARAERSRLRHQGRPDLVPGRNPSTALRLSALVRAEHRPPAHPGAASRLTARCCALRLAALDEAAPQVTILRGVDGRPRHGHGAVVDRLVGCSRDRRRGELRLVVDRRRGVDAQDRMDRWASHTRRCPCPWRSGSCPGASDLSG